MKNVLFILCVFIFAQKLQVTGTVLISPDKNIRVEVLLKNKIYYQVFYKNELVLNASPLTLSIDDQRLGVAPELLKSYEKSVNRMVSTVWWTRNEIKENYNELTLDFKNNFSVQFRAYNDGVTYRFITNLKKKQVKVFDEEVSFRFNFGVKSWILDGQSYESSYHQTTLDVKDIQNFKNVMDKIYLPVFVQSTPEVKVAITEAGLYDYPSLFLNRGNDYENFLKGSFEKVALSTQPGGFSNYMRLTSEKADYMALTNGKQSYPWRVLIISDRDATFADCDLVYLLSKPNQIKDPSWIKPGKVAWEWWNDYVVEGKDFKGGVNTETYKYYIDFAADYKLEYILIDWLWTDKYDLTLFNPDVDIKEIIEYGKLKNVRVILWCPGHTLHEQLEQTLALFSDLGAAGVKADFFGREDQSGIKMYEDIAKAAAKYKLLVDFHGCAKPTGLSRTYPNVVNYEAVAGNEYNKLEDVCTVGHKVMLPFTRSIQGPMDFTPGGMRNRQNDHAIFYTLPLVHGTRCNEMALYVIYHEPLKMLCDAPSVYREENDIINFISKIPTFWDESKVLQAKFGKYIVLARKTGDEWYVAGITDDNERIIDIDFSFLRKGKFQAIILTDGINANHVGTDYKIQQKEITQDASCSMKMAKGGGFIIHLKPM